MEINYYQLFLMQVKVSLLLLTLVFDKSVFSPGESTFSAQTERMLELIRLVDTI